MNKILFVSAFDYPTKYAHARHGLEMARAYHALCGDTFLFLVNMAPSLPVPYKRLFGPFGRRIKLMHFRRLLVPIRLFLFFLMDRSWQIVVVTDPVLFSPLIRLRSLFGFRLIVECHGALTQTQARALQKADLAIFTTQWLAKKYPRERSIVLPNAVDIEAFRLMSDRATLRSELKLPNGFLIGYIGRFAPLQMDKGLQFLIESLAALPDAHLVLVGGTRLEIPPYEALATAAGVRERVHIVPHVNVSLVPKYAKACDALVYVPKERSQFFEHETSPMKVFEYMAAERPVILSDTPALREILSEREAFFIPPGSRQAFVEAIAALQRGEGAVRAKAAYARVVGNTWRRRAEIIVQMLENVV